MPGKKVMMVLPPLGFDRHVYERTRLILEDRGHKVATTSLDPHVARSEDGRIVPVDVSFRDLKTYQWDAFVFIGGEGAKTFLDDERMQKLIRDIKYKQLAATGVAVAALARAEALKNKKMTGPYQFVGLYREGGGKFTNRPLEIDERLITLQDHEIPEQFANAIADALE